MKLKKFFASDAYLIISVLLCSLFSISILNQTFSFNLSTIVILIVESLALLLVYTIFKMRKNIFMYGIVCLLVIITAVIVIYYKIDLFSVFSKQYEWLYLFLNNKAQNEFINSLFWSFILAVIASIVFLILNIKAVPRFICGIAGLAGLVIMGFFEFDCNRLSVFCLVFYGISALSEFIFTIYYKPQDKNKATTAFSFLIPVFTILSIIIILLPANEKPIQWTFVKSTIKSVSTLVTSVAERINIFSAGGDSNYSMGIQGYTDSGVVNGQSLKTIDKRAFNYYTFTPTSIDLYLNGTIMDTYTQNNWQNNCSKHFTADEYLYDSDELLYALNRSSFMNNKKEIIRSRSITFYYDGITTKSIFYPSKTTEFSCDTKMKPIGSNLLFRHIAGYPTSYKLSFLELNYQSEDFLKFIDEQEGYQYSTNHLLYESTRGTNYHVLEKSPEYKLLKRKELIYKDYTDVPDCISQRVRDLALNITDGVDGDYYKLKAIENYLNDNYTYTKTPPAIPEGKELVDYFLFESKQGYCTYYATAMCILGRCAGIPTRYVQGFCCDNAMTSHNIYEVKNNSAHAWTEGYIDGIGWLCFEPTSTYHDSLYTEWSEIKSRPLEIVNQEGLRDERLQALKQKEMKEKVYTAVSFSLCAVILCCIVAFILFIILKRRKYIKTYNSYDDNRKIITDYNYILNVYELLGIKLIEGETLSEFASYKDNFFNYLDKSFKRATDYYTEVLYGNIHSDNKKSVYVKDYKDFVLSEVRVKTGKLKLAIIRTRLFFQKSK